ncbi:MAG: 4-alpha-glucanotransferase [Gammaproteobacteria bacterium]|nr:4-alpha-glucanotransferase [Gammaproteobacteria bacterium]NIR98123.1 4-alpha-glucanotransferase [Gammaproteobacteria bacterium]NIT63815.1 4-alpha-glucanotransferase [Gammaproteobacteria bacterium]NIV20765.1 4-alpha-glucanotransferase [Gammaproteobacteria bacterium]NIX10014.1 4-alpha-glucanotransferase [Gammaproteobacteria bacterium]
MTAGSRPKTAAHWESPLARRRAGLQIHPTSLPWDGLAGGMGRPAFRFADVLAESGISVWQTLPLGPTHADLSPYQCLSVFAGDPRLISLEPLAERGWLKVSGTLDPGDPGQHGQALARAFAGFRARAAPEERQALQEFREAQAYWLEDYCLYQALRHENGHVSWVDWPEALRDREQAALRRARTDLAERIECSCFEQFLFHRQWHALKAYANERGILLFGDMPIFVAHDSAEVWGRREYFTLDARGRPETVAGVPPDYFSETGQLWGNPHYRWSRMREDDYLWWRRRMEHQLALFDLTRIDHFRGFEAYWEVPAGAESAAEGRWVAAPGDELFETLHREFDPMPLVAEDLGVITEEVDALRHRYGLPGMKVLQFAFNGGPDNPYLPHNHAYDCVVYTGTHDNDTSVGWFESCPPEQRRRVRDYLGHPGEEWPWPLIRAALASVAAMAVIPMQDVLMLGGEHRMNTPGTVEGNWRWRLDWAMIPDDLPGRLRHLVELYGRAAQSEG